jgi:hypothetical protein
VGEGFATLASLDSNGDHKLNSQDQQFNELLVWQDKNGNHQTDAGELKTLKDWGITELNTGYATIPQEQNGNLLLERSKAIGAFGTPIDMVDVYFQRAKRNRLNRASKQKKDKEPVRPVPLKTQRQQARRGRVLRCSRYCR